MEISRQCFCASWWSSGEAKDKMGASSSREQTCLSIQGSPEVADRIRDWKQAYFKSNVYKAVFDRLQDEAGRYSFFKLIFLTDYVVCWLIFSLGATCLLTTVEEVLHSFIAVLYPLLSCPSHSLQSQFNLQSIKNILFSFPKSALKPKLPTAEVNAGLGWIQGVLELHTNKSCNWLGSFYEAWM